VVSELISYISISARSADTEYNTERSLVSGMYVNEFLSSAENLPLRVKAKTSHREAPLLAYAKKRSGCSKRSAFALLLSMVSELIPSIMSSESDTNSPVTGSIFGTSSTLQAI
jgi:hypothetical protein